MPRHRKRLVVIVLLLEMQMQVQPVQGFRADATASNTAVLSWMQGQPGWFAPEFAMHRIA